MWGNQIEEKMKSYPNFLGVFARDTLPRRVDGQAGLIVNTDTRTQVGSHWIAIYVDENSYGQFFDSFGLPPFLDEFLKFLYCNCEEHFFNNVPLQCDECITCGLYCCVFLAARFNGYSYPDFISKFTGNRYTNDDLVKRYFDEMG
jgi:hypothetical protein